MTNIKRLLRLSVVAGCCIGLSAFSACKEKGAPADVATRPLTLKYASLLAMEAADSFLKVTVRDPWGGAGAQTDYVLVPDSFKALPAALPAGVVIRTPLKRVVCGAAVHAALVGELGAGGALAGLCDMDYVVGDDLKALCRDNGVKDMGSSMRLDAESVEHAQADALWLSPYENAGYGAVERLGIPIVKCADYMETSPLGRAEWMRFYGRLVGRAAQADSLFERVERDYLDIKNGVAGRSKRPEVMADLKEGNVWFVPGGHSTMGRMFTDAGGRYLWADRTESGSLQLDFESVFTRAADARVWLIKHGTKAGISYASLATDFPPYKQFRPWRERQIYVCNTLEVPFFEEVPFHPERLLENLSNIFAGSGDGRYYKKLH